MKTSYILLFVLLLCTPVFGQQTSPNRLTNSPRHQEWVAVKNGNRTVHSFVVYPEKKEKTAVVIVIHENRGLTDWARGVADQLAEAGYIAIAPDLLSGSAPNGGRTSDFPNEDAAREAIHKLEAEQVMSDLNAVADYALQLPASNKKLTVSGFCWGGGQSFRFATKRPDLKAAFVFYGAFQYTKEQLSAIACPVYGFYGSDDARINATLPESKDLMKQLGKTFEAVIYEGAGHGFMRSGEAPDASSANKSAREAAWKRWKELLAKM